MDDDVTSPRNEPCATCIGRKGTPLNSQKDSPVLLAIVANLEAGMALFCHEGQEQRVCAAFARAQEARRHEPSFVPRTMDDVTCA
jgi:hypothetical protein